MRTRARACADIIRLSSFIVLTLTMTLLSAAAQSGRVIPTPQPTPTPELSDAKPKFVVDPNADKYKLVFPVGYERKFFFTGKKEKVDEVATRHAYFDSFVEQLNEAGAQGYRLISSVDGSMAVVQLDKVQYEYAWFETISSSFFAKDGFAGQYAPMAKKGFRLADHALFYAFCEASEDSFTETCEYKEFFLLEREKGVEEAREHSLVYAVPRRGSKPGVELTDAVKKKVAAGFYPISLLSKYEILVEQTGEHMSGKQDVEIARASSFWGKDNAPKRINELAKQGYRLALANREIAVMYRHDDNATPVSYIWLEVGKRDLMLRRKKRNFEKELAKLLESGAVYRTTYPNSMGDENELIFELGGAADGKRREYKILRFETESVGNEADKKVVFDLTPASKEALKEFHRLVKEGFVVRDLFMADEPHVILERTR